jgi:SAM-dependent methyltransferase
VNVDPIVSAVAAYYAAKITEHGPTPRGVDWNSSESQHLRFVKLLQVIDSDTSTSGRHLLDYGCGFGSLADMLESDYPTVFYQGYDIANEMITAARASHPHFAGQFFSDERLLRPTDYVVASGLFNVRLDTPVPDWEAYVFAKLDLLQNLSTRGFAFNMLTSYADEDRKRVDLYYADPRVMFDYCKRRYSPRVALLHDYPLWEFTMLVRKG